MVCEIKQHADYGSWRCTSHSLGSPILVEPPRTSAMQRFFFLEGAVSVAEKGPTSCSQTKQSAHCEGPSAYFVGSESKKVSPVLPVGRHMCLILASGNSSGRASGVGVIASPTCTARGLEVCSHSELGTTYICRSDEILEVVLAAVFRKPLGAIQATKWKEADVGVFAPECWRIFTVRWKVNI